MRAVMPTPPSIAWADVTWQSCGGSGSKVAKLADGHIGVTSARVARFSTSVSGPHKMLLCTGYGWHIV